MVKERDIENLLEQALTNNGWVINSNSKNRNVFHQSPKSKEDKKKLKGLEPDFCLYITDTSTNPEIILETKKPNMNLVKTKEQALKYAKLLGSRIIILFDGLQTKHYWVNNEELLLEDGVEVSIIKRPDFYKRFIASDSNKLETSLINVNTKEDLINVFAYTNQKLRKAGITKGMERFFEFSNLLFLKLISESNDIVSQAIPDFIKWETYKNKTGEELLRYINDTVIPTLENIFNRNGTEKSLFTKLIIKDTIALKQIIDKLSSLNLSGIKTDIKGDAFEYFIQQYNSSNNDLGEYFTPRHIVNFLIKLANPKYGEVVYDPFCGTGGILIAAFNHIKEQLCSNNYLTEAVLNDIKEHTVYGSEISSNARIAKMNMILTGDGHNNIKQQDTLLNPIKDKFDIVITNIPFNLEGTAKNLYTLLSDNGNSQSIQHVIDSLKQSPLSRAYIIVPEAVLNNQELKGLRKYMIDNHLLKQIISLPSGVFLPYTESKASILVLQSFNNSPISKIKYTIIKNDGFTLTQRRRKINTVNDIDEYLFDNSYATKEIAINKIMKNKNYSFIWFKYFSEVSENHILLKDILKEEKIKNVELYETATVTKRSFYGILSGEEYWGESFMSVTSETNEDYKVVNFKSLAYNPSRANTGSLSINLTNRKLAVSKMYVTFKVVDERFLPEYVFLYLKSQEGLQNIKDRSFGSVRQALRFDDLCTISIPIIPISKQLEIVNSVQRKYSDFIKHKDELDQFNIKDGLFL